MIREAKADSSTEADVQRWQRKAFRDWCRVGDPVAVTQARRIRRREEEVTRSMKAWLRKKRRAA